MFKRFMLASVLAVFGVILAAGSASAYDPYCNGGGYGYGGYYSQRPVVALPYPSHHHHSTPYIGPNRSGFGGYGGYGGYQSYRPNYGGGYGGGYGGYSGGYGSPYGGYRGGSGFSLYIGR